MALVPLRIKIGLKGNNQHAFPDFNKIDESFRGNMDWSYYVDKFGGWHYDQVSGHRDDSPHSPRGQWLGMLFIPEIFAKEAVRLFPAECVILTEGEAEDFYDHYAHINDAEVFEDEKVLQAMVAKKQLGMELSQTDQNALDPDHPQPGRRINKRKTWQGYKQAEGIVLKEHK